MVAVPEEMEMASTPSPRSTYGRLSPISSALLPTFVSRLPRPHWPSSLRPKH